MSEKDLTIHIEEELMRDAEQVFDQLGLDLNSAIKMFLKRSVLEQGIPFSMKLGAEPTPFAAERISMSPFPTGLLSQVPDTTVYPEHLFDNCETQEEIDAMKEKFDLFQEWL